MSFIFCWPNKLDDLTWTLQQVFILAQNPGISEHQFNIKFKSIAVIRTISNCVSGQYNQNIPFAHEAAKDCLQPCIDELKEVRQRLARTAHPGKFSNSVRTELAGWSGHPV